MPDNEPEDDNNISIVQVENSLEEKILEYQAKLTTANQKNDEWSSKYETLMNRNQQHSADFEYQLLNIKTQAAEWEEKFNAVSIENDNLKKRIHELEINVQESRTISKKARRSKVPKSDENKEYEVNALLAHKKRNGEMHFLIHWKNFDSKHDSWEREGNLECSTLLNRYKKANNLN